MRETEYLFFSFIGLILCKWTLKGGNAGGPNVGVVESCVSGSNTGELATVPVFAIRFGGRKGPRAGMRLPGLPLRPIDCTGHRKGRGIANH